MKMHTAYITAWRCLNLTINSPPGVVLIILEIIAYVLNISITQDDSHTAHTIVHTSIVHSYCFRYLYRISLNVLDYLNRKQVGER